MFTIHKQALAVKELQTIELPEGSKIIKADNQGGALCVWYECNPELEMTPRTILVLGTGHQFPDNCPPNICKHIGTALFGGGQLVFHAYEVSM
jgi:hypothetical protein